MADDNMVDGNLDFSTKSSLSVKNRISVMMSGAAAMDWLHRTKERVKPWVTFADTGRFKLPSGLAVVPKRVVTNVKTFQGNYLFVFFGLVLFCVLTSPLLLVVIAACAGACYIISIKNAEHPVVFMGRQLTTTQQYLLVGAASFPLLWLAGAGSAVFWIIGASVFFILLHAAVYAPLDQSDGFDVEMSSIQTA